MSNILPVGLSEWKYCENTNQYFKNKCAYQVLSSANRGGLRKRPSAVLCNANKETVLAVKWCLGYLVCSETASDDKPEHWMQTPHSVITRSTMNLFREGVYLSSTTPWLAASCVSRPRNHPKLRLIILNIDTGSRTKAEERSSDMTEKEDIAGKLPKMGGKH